MFSKSLLFAFTQWTVTTAKDPLRPILKSAFVKTCLNLHYKADYETALGDVFSKKHSGRICQTRQFKLPVITTLTREPGWAFSLVSLRQEAGTARPEAPSGSSGTLGLGTRCEQAPKSLSEASA